MRRPNKKELELLRDATLRKTAEVGLAYAKKNMPYIKKTVKDIKNGNGLSCAIVIAAGPSLHRKDSIVKIKKANTKAHIVATDGTLSYCLRNGVVPDFVLTVDPHPYRIVRWFGDRKLSKRPTDDYFRRQDLDPALNRNEVLRNKELIKLVNYYGPKIKVIISTSVNPEVTLRCREAKMDLYWWNPLYDDYEKPNSYSRKIYQMTKVPCMVTGGNGGTSAWVFSHAILKSKNVFMVGMDFSYPPASHIRRTQYYEVFKKISENNPTDCLIKVYNPYLKQTWLTDPTYYWYRQSFLEIVKLAPCKTYNCTEGGILFGEGIEFIPLKAALAALRK